ncbi:MAG: NAD(P) transhydrogenase subunit alpha [Planctomycetota bacterium]
MLIFAPRQADPDESRASLTPSVVKKWVGKGVSVTVEPGLGTGAFLQDQAFEEAGATFAGEGHRAWEDADVVVTLGPPRAEDVRRMRAGAVLIGMLSPTTEPELVRAAAESKVSAVSLEFVPRTSRAQAMDVLSSQANLAGYKAVLLGASHCPKLMPMMITAAGTLAPARVLVVGVGVAGLQAIATAKRLGAVVEAYDVRPATKEQVQSLGARFVELPAVEASASGGTSEETSGSASGGGGEGKGGYAAEQTEEDRQRQADLMAKHVVGADLVVTTAALFGKAPPMLIPAEVVGRMKAGAVVVDLAASAAHGRGNCELTRPGEVTKTQGGVTLVGTTNLPGTMAVHASTVYANNLHALLETLLVEAADSGHDADHEADGEEPGEAEGLVPRVDLDDDIHVDALITHAGRVVNELVRQTLEDA